MATITPKVAVLTGVDPLAYVAAAASDVFDAQPGARYLIHVKNGGGSPDTVRIDDPNSQTPLGAEAFNPDLLVSVPAGGERMILVNDPARFINSSTGQITVSHSFTTSVTLQVVRV